MGGITLTQRRPTGTGGHWIPLMDYAIRRGVSLSTLRRHIKANKIQYRVENGRYLLWDDEQGGATPAQDSARKTETRSHSAQPSTTDPNSAHLQSKLQRVERDLQKAQEEIAELKMLIALYEEKISRDRLDS